MDCSASSETVEILMKAVDFGCCVVLANKKPLTSTLVTSYLHMWTSKNVQLSYLFALLVLLW